MADNSYTDATFTLIVLFLRWLLYSHISRALERLQKLNQQIWKKKGAQGGV